MPEEIRRKRVAHVKTRHRKDTVELVAVLSGCRHMKYFSDCSISYWRGSLSMARASGLRATKLRFVQQ